MGVSFERDKGTVSCEQAYGPFGRQLVYRKLASRLQRSSPTRRSLMGKTPIAIGFTGGGIKTTATLDQLCSFQCIVICFNFFLTELVLFDPAELL